MEFELTLEELEEIEREAYAIENAPKVLFYAVNTEKGWKVTNTPQEGQEGFVSFWLAEALCCQKEDNQAGFDYAIEMSNPVKQVVVPESYRY
jgi:hypothetical protein